MYNGQDVQNVRLLNIRQQRLIQAVHTAYKSAKAIRNHIAEIHITSEVFGSTGGGNQGKPSTSTSSYMRGSGGILLMFVKTPAIEEPASCLNV